MALVDSSGSGTLVERASAKPIKPIPMKTNADRARKLKDAAARWMVAGDVPRHLHALRLLIDLRLRNAVASA